MKTLCIEGPRLGFGELDSIMEGSLGASAYRDLPERLPHL
jgi:hypothetical protein